MKILNLEQNTTEWLEFRRSKIGASDVAKLMTGSKRAINNLFLEKKGGERERAPTSAMRHGHQTEPLARAWTNDFFNTDFEPIVVQHSEIDYLIASLDGYDQSKNLIVEIKCPTRSISNVQNLVSYKQYIWQIQTQLLVSGASKCLLVAYSEDKQSTEVIYPDSDLHKQIIERIDWFHMFIEIGELPYGSLELDEDHQKQVKPKVDVFLEASRAFEIAKASLEEARKEVIKAGGGEGYQFGPITVSEVKGREIIDYRSACKDACIDTSSYKKTGSSSWRVAISK